MIIIRYLFIDRQVDTAAWNISRQLIVPFIFCQNIFDGSI